MKSEQQLNTSQQAKDQRQTEKTMDGWSATRSREVRSNRVGGNDTGS
jgi:hypothetical protein